MRFRPFLFLEVFSPRYLKVVLRLLKDRRVPFWTKLIPLAAVVYVLLPTDLVPDFLFPFFSQLDDLLVLVLALRLFPRLVPPEILQEHVLRVAREKR